MAGFKTGVLVGAAVVGVGAAWLFERAESGLAAQAEIQPLTSEQVNDARQAVASWIGENGQALLICGRSNGLGLFAGQMEKGFQPDGMKDGRLVFLLRSDGSPDVIFRDATGRFLSAVDDGGTVTRLNDGNHESWIIGYRETGVTETHNITSADSRLIDLWTSNKPAVVLPSSAKLFVSDCQRA